MCLSAICASVPPCYVPPSGESCTSSRDILCLDETADSEITTADDELRQLRSKERKVAEMEMDERTSEKYAQVVFRRKNKEPPVKFN